MGQIDFLLFSFLVFLLFSIISYYLSLFSVTFILTNADSFEQGIKRIIRFVMAIFFMSLFFRYYFDIWFVLVTTTVIFVYLMTIDYEKVWNIIQKIKKSR